MYYDFGISRGPIFGAGLACCLPLVPMVVCPGVGGGYDATVSQELGNALGAICGGRRPWSLFMLHDVPVDSVCIKTVTQDRGTRVPPVKSFTACCRQSLRICACQILEYATVLDLELDWKVELDWN